MSALLLGLRPLDWGNAPAVYVFTNPTDDQFAAVLEAVEGHEAYSAAILNDFPPTDRRWLAYEFRHKVVTGLGIDTQRLEALGWRPERHAGVTVWSPSELEGSARARFASDILGAAPRTIEVPVNQPLADIGLFADLAASRQGGSSALMALSGAYGARETVLLRNPAALELDVERNPESISYLVETSIISVRAIGASFGMGPERFELDGFSDPVAVRDVWALDERRSGFAIVLQITAVVDPVVAIPSGHIFEQATINGVQTLAISSATSIVIGEGMSVTRVVPAWCLNSDLSPPSGQGLRLTPLRARYPSGTDQGDVWRDRARIAAS